MWIDPETNEIVKFHSDIRALRPNWSGPNIITDDMIADLGFVPVVLTAPMYDPIYQFATELAPVQIDGVWTQQWSIDGLPDATAQANLTAAIQTKIAEIDAACLTANYTTFPYLDHSIACDALSRSYIDGANGWIALHNELPPNWPGAWKTTVPNVYVPIQTIDAWKAMYTAMYDQGNANFQHSEELKTQARKANNSADLEKIQWGL